MRKRNARIGSRNETYEKKSHGSVQGQSCFGLNQGREDAGRAGHAVWRSHESDHVMEGGADQSLHLDFFSSAAERKEAANGPEIGTLHVKIVQQTIEIGFLAVALGRMDGASAKK